MFTFSKAAGGMLAVASAMTLSACSGAPVIKERYAAQAFHHQARADTGYDYLAPPYYAPGYHPMRVTSGY